MNALIAVGNVADRSDPAVAPVLVGYLAHDDPALRATAVWAARRLGLDELLGAVATDIGTVNRLLDTIADLNAQDWTDHACR